MQNLNDSNEKKEILKKWRKNINQTLNLTEKINNLTKKIIIESIGDSIIRTEKYLDNEHRSIMKGDYFFISIPPENKENLLLLQENLLVLIKNNARINMTKYNYYTEEDIEKLDIKIFSSMHKAFLLDELYVNDTKFFSIVIKVSESNNLKPFPDYAMM